MKRFQHPNSDISRIIPGCGVWLWLEFQILGDQRPNYVEREGLNTIWRGNKTADLLRILGACPT